MYVFDGCRTLVRESQRLGVVCMHCIAHTYMWYVCAVDCGLVYIVIAYNIQYVYMRICKISCTYIRTYIHCAIIALYVHCV